MLTILAQTEPSGGGAGGLVIFLPLILLFYFFMIRPQRQRMKQHQEMVRQIQIGDEIETVAGIFGTVERMSDEHLWVQVAPGTTLKMSRGAVRRRIVPEIPTPDDQTG